MTLKAGWWLQVNGDPGRLNGKRNDDERKDEADEADRVDPDDPDEDGPDDPENTDDADVAKVEQEACVWSRELTVAEDKECNELIAHIHFQMNRAAEVIQCTLSSHSDVLPGDQRKWLACRAENAEAYESVRMNHRRGLLLLSLQVSAHCRTTLSPRIL